MPDHDHDMFTCPLAAGSRNCLVLVYGDWAPISTQEWCLHGDTFLSIPKDGITGSDGKSLLNSTSK